MQTKSGKPVFPIGIGTWNIGGTFNPNNPMAKYKGAEPNSDNEEAEIAAIRYSIEKGQNHIDCAELYGAFHTDEVVGKAINSSERTDLFIADKLWRTSVGEGLVRPTVEKMLEKLGTDYLDLLYIHAPWEGIDWQAALPQIDELIDEGLVLGFGVSNFTVDNMKEAQSLARHPIVANQMNFNVLHKDEVSETFEKYCKENNVQIVAYQPIKRQEVLANTTIQQVAGNHNATPAQIALAWLIAQGALPIPKSINLTHIDENVASVGIKLTSDEVDILTRL